MFAINKEKKKIRCITSCTAQTFQVKEYNVTVNVNYLSHIIIYVCYSKLCNSIHCVGLSTACLTIRKDSCCIICLGSCNSEFSFK